jgi:hypothetical protein
MGPIKLYAPERYREPKLYTHSELLFPFWGVTAKESVPYVRAASLQYQYAKKDFTLVDHIEDSDYVFVPYQYERLKEVNPGKLTDIIAEAKSAGKPLLIDGSGDIEHPISIPNSIILRISQYAYSTQPNEITIPAIAEDLLESYADGKLSLRKKPNNPSVGFTGWASLSLTARLKLWLKELPILFGELADERRGAEHKGLLFRTRALKVLSESLRVKPNLTARTTYSGHVKTIQGSAKNNRMQFVENLLTSDYALCAKGDGNYSVRFYEALSLGRIPLFLDTACVLPLEDKINYRDFCVFVDWRDTDRLDDVLADFHAAISHEKFVEMQKKARDAYRNYLRVDAFSHWLAAELHFRKIRL